MFFSELSHTCSYRSCFISCRALNVFHICEATLFGVTGPATQLLDQSLAGTRYHKMSQASKTRPRIEVGLQWICETNWPQVCPTYQRGSDVVPLGHTGHAGHTGPYWAILGHGGLGVTCLRIHKHDLCSCSLPIARCPESGVERWSGWNHREQLRRKQSTAFLHVLTSIHRSVWPIWPRMAMYDPCPSMSMSQSPVSAAETLNFCLAIHANNANENHLESDPS